MGLEVDHCLNCRAPLAGRFCAACGQRSDIRRMDWRWLWDEFMTSVLVVDRGILFTIRQLFSRPGHALREYIEGRRKPHFKPLAFVALPAALYSLLYLWFFQVDPVILGLPPEAKRIGDVMNQLMGDYYALIELGTVPMLSLFTWLAFRSWGHHYVEHVVMNAFLSGQRILINILLLPFNLLGSTAMFSATSFAFLAYAVAFVLAFRQVYQSRPSGSVVGRILLVVMMLAVTLIVVPIMIGVVYAIRVNAR